MVVDNGEVSSCSTVNMRVNSPRFNPGPASFHSELQTTDDIYDYYYTIYVSILMSSRRHCMALDLLRIAG